MGKSLTTINNYDKGHTKGAFTLLECFYSEYLFIKKIKYAKRNDKIMTVDIDLINNKIVKIELSTSSLAFYSVCLQSMYFYLERQDPRGWTRCVLTVVRHLAGKCPIDQTKSLTQEK